MKNLFFLLLFISFSGVSFSQQREFESKEGDSVYVMKQYFMCIYIKGEKRNQDSLTLQRLQRGHLDHINDMAKKGVVLMAGPLGGSTEKKGILVFDVSTKEEAENWVKKDPMVLAGRLSYEILPWWTAKGSVLK